MRGNDRKVRGIHTPHVLESRAWWKMLLMEKAVLEAAKSDAVMARTFILTAELGSKMVFQRQKMENRAW